MKLQYHEQLSNGNEHRSGCPPTFIIWLSNCLLILSLVLDSPLRALTIDHLRLCRLTLHVKLYCRFRNRRDSRYQQSITATHLELFLLDVRLVT